MKVNSDVRVNDSKKKKSYRHFFIIDCNFLPINERVQWKIYNCSWKHESRDSINNSQSNNILINPLLKLIKCVHSFILLFVQILNNEIKYNKKYYFSD